MNITKKIVSVLLALCLILGCASAFSQVFAADKLNYLVLGDSIGYGAGIFNPDEACYGRIVADTNGYNYTNYAVNGYTSSQLIDHITNKSYVRNAVINADIISISIGGNDFLASNLVSLVAQGLILKDFSAFDEIAENFYANFTTIIEDIKSINPDVQILVQTLYNPNYTFLRRTYQQGADRLNSCYTRYLEEHPDSYEIVDVATAFEGHSEYIAPDTIHPNTAGNLVIARLVLAKLYELGLGETTQPVILADSLDFSLEDSYKIIIRIMINLVSTLFAA